MDTAQVDLSRDRRVTLTSPIPAQIAEEMLSGEHGRGPPTLPGTMSAAVRAARDPARSAPTSTRAGSATREDEGEEQHTRRVGDSDRAAARLGVGAGHVLGGGDRRLRGSVRRRSSTRRARRSTRAI